MGFSFFQYFSSRFCGCLKTPQTSFCVRCWWASCSLWHPTSNCWLLISSQTLRSLKSSFHVGYSEVFEEKSAGVQFFGFAVVLHGCWVVPCLDWHHWVTWAMQLCSVSKEASLESVCGPSSVKIPTKEGLWLMGLGGWLLGVFLYN